MDTIYSFDYYTESWIEVSSQPSSSSLSSIATDDRGLRLQHDYHARRRRRLNPNAPSLYNRHLRPTSAAGSSQEEYEESESESDRIMTSSNEGLEPQFSDAISPPAPTSSASEPISSEENDDDDENSTALGVLRTEPVFTPQPNAFSHPPQAAVTTNTQSVDARTSYFQSQRASTSRPQNHSYPQHRNRSHTPYNVIAPSHQADHDAALRASLSTLLSCAAAARGLPKREAPAQQPTVRASNRVEPSTIRMVPESALIREEATRQRPIVRRTSTESLNYTRDKQKRKASTSRDRRDKKKTRRGSIEDLGISPTLLTWVVSAGVVVLVSAISFSAGYSVGKEVGKVEASIGGNGNGPLCGKEMGRGLRKLRLGTPTVS
ncbi:MAG: hypothetical protein Q9183_001960 [Haloplaca sp. 2 TL-2023]